MSTGAELREPGDAAGPRLDLRRQLLHARRRGRAPPAAIAYRVGIVSDDARGVHRALTDQLVRADIVVTSGGVSKGDYDVVKEVLAGRSGTVWFGGVAMQPGKPQGFGVVGEDETPIFTLPGNPVSAYVSFQVFVLPALRKMHGPHALRAGPLRTARLTHGLSLARGQAAVRARRRTTRPAGVTPVGGHGSHLIGDLAAANALIVVPEDVTRLARRAITVQVLLLDEEF